MTRDDVQRWLDRYVDAWRTYEPAAIAALFADDATYAYRPYRDPVRGREAIVADWLEGRDEPGTWEARYEAYAADGDRAVAVGETRYLEADGSLEKLYHNAWFLRFDGTGKCVEFVEYWMELPEELRPGR